MKRPLDEIDYKIVEILRKDARTPFTKVGEELEISDATVHVRVKKLLQEGIIKRYTIVVDEEAFGRKVNGLVLLDVRPGTLEEVLTYLLAIRGVSSIYEIHGPNDLIILIGGLDLDDMREILLKIREIPNVTASELLTIYKVWKERDD